MKTLRRAAQYSLNEGDGAVKGLYNVTNELLLESTKDQGVSYWFDENTKDLLMMVEERNFLRRCRQMAG